jgi:hypothetical protein
LLARFTLAFVQTEHGIECVAECLWPGVSEADLSSLDARVDALADQLAGAVNDVRYLGSLLICEDEVVACMFQGSAAAVRRLAEEAEIPFERILEATYSPHRAKPDPTSTNPRRA